MYDRLRHNFADKSAAGFPVSLSTLFSFSSMKSTLKSFWSTINNTLEHVGDLYNRSAFQVGFIDQKTILQQMNRANSGSVSGLMPAAARRDYTLAATNYAQLQLSLMATTMLSLPMATQIKHATMLSVLAKEEAALAVEKASLLEELFVTDITIEEQRAIEDKTIEDIQQSEKDLYAAEEIVLETQQKYEDAVVQVNVAEMERNTLLVIYHQEHSAHDATHEKMLHDENDRHVRWDTEKKLFYSVKIDGTVYIYDEALQAEYANLIDVNITLDNLHDYLDSDKYIPGNVLDIIREQKNAIQAKLDKANACYDGACEIRSQAEINLEEAQAVHDSVRTLLNEQQRELIKIRSSIKELALSRDEIEEKLEIVQSVLDNIKTMREYLRSDETINGLKDGSVTIEDIENKLKETPRLYGVYQEKIAQEIALRIQDKAPHTLSNEFDTSSGLRVPVYIVKAPQFLHNDEGAPVLKLQHA